MEYWLMKRAAIAAVAAASTLSAGQAQAGGVPGQGTWETTLQPRDIDGDGMTDAFYDTVLDITWLRSVNAWHVNDWDTAMTWANTLVVGGVDGWRLPTVVDTGAPGCDLSLAGGTDCGYNMDTATGEMAHLWYATLGNLARCPPGDADCAGDPPTGWGLTNTGGFQYLHSGAYWYGTEYAPRPVNAWYFSVFDGLQNAADKSFSLFSMAVRPGDVAAVPEPQTYAMLLLGLGGVLLAVRQRAH